jgi:molybdenum cofactor biosynthesis protein B
MVDFQSRDTRRRGETESSDEQEDDPEQVEGAPEQEDQPTDAESQSDVETGTDPESQAPADADATPADGDVAGTAGSTPESEPTDQREPGTAPAEEAPVPDADTPTTDHEEPASGTDARSIDIALVAVGDAATSADDPNPTTDRLTDSLTATGHSVPVTRELAGGYDEIQGAVDGLVSRPDVDAVVTVGGTGVAQSDVVIEAIHPLFEKVLPGFGEVVRDLLFYQAGTGVVGVRATAGIAGSSPVFCLPGERNLAVRAVEEVVAAEAPALVAQLE